MVIGEAIAAQRLAIGASKSWLAKKVGVHRNTVANWESGRSEPTSTELVRIANALGCLVMDLLRGVDPAPVRTSRDFCPGA